MDHILAKHFANLFIRDPLVIFSESIDQDDETMSDHFEVSLPFAFCFLTTLTITFLEHSIHQLANTTLQASTPNFLNGMARRVPPHGSPNDRF